MMVGNLRFIASCFNIRYFYAILIIESCMCNMLLSIGSRLQKLISIFNFFCIFRSLQNIFCALICTVLYCVIFIQWEESYRITNFLEQCLKEIYVAISINFNETCAICFDVKCYSNANKWISRKRYLINLKDISL